MRVTCFTESRRVFCSAGDAPLFVLLVDLLLRISAPPVVWIDATGNSRPTDERNRSERSEQALGLAADRQGSVTGEVDLEEVQPLVWRS
jgi:hypothetical protein